MKKCVIWFAVLVLTLLIAVWAEHQQGNVLREELAFDKSGSEISSGVDYTHNPQPGSP